MRLDDLSPELHIRMTGVQRKANLRYGVIVSLLKVWLANTLFHGSKCSFCFQTAVSKSHSYMSHMSYII